MKYLIFFILVFNTILLGNNDYILVDEYLKKHPEQKKVFENFSKLVDKKGEKTNLNQKKPVKIYMIYPGNQISDYWRRSKSSFEARLNEIGIKYELIDHFTKPSIEISKQASSLFKALKSDIDYIIFTLDAKKHVKFISTILNKEKPKLILQNITTPLKLLGDRQPLLYDGFDHTIGAKMLAKEYIKTTNGKGNYAVLYGPIGYVSSMRGDSFVEYMKQNSELKMVESYYTDFNKQKAKLAVFDLLENHKNIEFIYACSTDIALGAIEALKEKKLLGKIKINGWGGGSAELEAVKKGEMDFTVMRMNDDNGAAMAEAVKLHMQKRSQDIPLIYSGKFILVKKGIKQNDLEELKNKAFRYSGK